MHKIFTLGYIGWKSADLLAQVERLDAVLVDIRYSAWSRAPQWRGPELQDLVGRERYRWVQDLGNVNYKNGGPIRLSNPTAAVPRIGTILQERPVILLCACKDVMLCHRRTAADYLAKALGVDVEHLTPDTSPASDHTMRALSLTQPWASLLVSGDKHYETRSFRTNYRGTVAIHASKGFPREAREDTLASRPICSALVKASYNRLSELPRGAVLGTVDIVDCVRTEDIAPSLSSDERAFGDYTPGRWAWLCEKPLRFETPLPAKGQLGLWNWQVPEGLLV